MLANPDISPSASINRWIVAILTFHFNLVHVAGTHHGPDGLSRRPHQDGDDEEKDDELDFEDWIDQLHGFMHQINIVTPHAPLFLHILTLAPSTDPSEEDINPMDAKINSYKLFPQSTQARLDDLCLLKVFKWLQDLIQPDDLSDLEYVTFM
jgi:hypothetical protein